MPDPVQTGVVTEPPVEDQSQVGCELTVDVGAGGVTLLLQVAPARAGVDVVSEALVVEQHGEPVDAVISVVDSPHGGRIHVVAVPAGEVRIAYDGVVRPTAVIDVPRGAADPIDFDAHVYLRQSRYCPSDQLLGLATAELRDLPDGPDRPTAIADWVFERLGYELGSSGPLDTAVDTLLAGRGVCRDFAHVTVTLCRAMEIPARLAAVYAPGLSPMDFHAVAEVRVEGRWEVLDATRLAPRPTLVRIATGRDAADTSFLSTWHGDAELLSSTVTAVSEGDLPLDDHRRRMRLR
jgi:transglutaminase-like putative cysteine protease